MGYLFLGIMLLVALVFFLKWYAKASAASILKVLKWGGITLAVVVGLFFLLRRVPVPVDWRISPAFANARL